MSSDRYDRAAPGLIPFYTESTWKGPWDDSARIRPVENPLQLKSLCLRNNSFWHHHSQANHLTLKDMASLICKEAGNFLQK